MQYKEYGKTGKMVSVIGFGGMRFLPEDYQRSLEISAQVVRHAFHKGINYFDTAPNYCDDTSEDIFGIAFKAMPRDKFYVSTKSMVYSEKDADAVQKRIDKSLTRMGVDKIDFFHMWCITSMEQYNMVMAKGGPYDGAVKAKEQGLIDHIVFSTHCNGRDIERMVNDDAFEGVTLGYNAANFAYRQQGIKAAYNKGIGVVTMNPLSGGVIPQNPDLYGFLVHGTDDSVAQAALKFNAGHKEISVVLAGMGTVQEVDENVLAGDNYDEIGDAERKRLSAYLNEHMNNLCTGCQYCTGCPAEIHIPEMMSAYNHFLLKNSPEDVLNELKYHWHIPQEESEECVECGMCERKCTQKLPIIKRLKEIAKMKG